MNKYVLILFIVITFASDTVLVMAQENGLPQRVEIIASVVALVCLSMGVVFLIELMRK
jgi:hypothetical protein